MQTLILLGNGFDLAHGLPTTYQQFLKNTWDAHVKDKSLYNKIYMINPQRVSTFDALVKYPVKTSSVRNAFLRDILSDLKRKGWFDIEQLYFDKLLNNETNITQLNREFDNIKLTLEEYLYNINENSKPIQHYSEFFDRIYDRVSVLNFNYTSTWRHYFEEDKVFNIHGQINDESNPIIFGYAANEKDAQLLIDKNNNEYLENIKEYHYNNYTSLDNLLEFLARDDTRIFLFGHSCSISDQLILSEIFNHESVSELFIFYYRNRADYLDKQANISRVMAGNWREKIQNFSICSHMPQYDDQTGVSQTFAL